MNMLSMVRDFQKYASMVAKAIREHRWEQHANGILLPRERCIVGGFYTTRTTPRADRLRFGLCGPWSAPDHNLVPNEGLNFILDLAGNNAAAAAAYIALYGGNYTPIAANTAAGFASTYTEITSGSEGYEESTRVLWDTGAATSQAVNNYSAPAEFTIITAGSLTVYGVALLTASAKGSTSGKLLSASKFGAAKTFADDDTFEVKYQLGLASS